MHGAGHSALSFAALAKELKNEFTTVAFDFRGHGDHYCDDETDLSETTLVKDAIVVMKHICQAYQDRSVIIVGHSMGGSIATKSVKALLEECGPGSDLTKQIAGLFVIDVVEGSAMDALPFMENIVLSRPQEFSTLQSVVQWGIKSNTVRDLESARVSMPAQVVETKDNKGKSKFVWRTNLLASKEFWSGWFKDLTQIFLDVKVPKQLLLAGSDRMDKELTIAQMQGKFKLVVMNNVGHVIQEDQPKKVAAVFKDFLEIFRIPLKYNEMKVVMSVSGKPIQIGH